MNRGAWRAMIHNNIEPNTSEVTSFIIQLLSQVQLFETPCTVACQVSLSFTISWSLLKLMSVESVVPSNHLTLCLKWVAISLSKGFSYSRDQTRVSCPTGSLQHFGQILMVQFDFTVLDA